MENVSMKDLNAFFLAAAGIKREGDYAPVYLAHKDLFAQMGWDVPDAHAFRVKVGDLRVAAAAAVMRMRAEEMGTAARTPTVWKGEHAPKAPKAPKSAIWTVTLLTEKGEIGTYRAEVTDPKTGKPVMQDKPLVRGFDLYHRAEAWANKALVEKGAKGWIAQVRTSVKGGMLEDLECDLLRDNVNTAEIFGKRGDATAYHVRKVKAPARGRWMKDHQTSTARFSRG